MICDDAGRKVTLMPVDLIRQEARTGFTLSDRDFFELNRNRVLKLA